MDALRKIPTSFEDLTKEKIVELIESYPLKGDEFHEVLELILLTMEQEETGEIGESAVAASYKILGPRYYELSKKVIGS